MPQEKLGLIGMNARARTLGGTLHIRSHPGRGSDITVVIPLRRSGEAEFG